MWLLLLLFPGVLVSTFLCRPLAGVVFFVLDESVHSDKEVVEMVHARMMVPVSV